MKKCIVIYNPHSGKKNNVNLLPKFDEILSSYGYESKIIFTKYHGHAIDIVKNLEPVDLVISIGGDGTFNESITGNFLRKDRLLCAHIPSGTTNDIGAMFGYGHNMLDNLKLTLEGVVKQVDICTINNKPFIYVAAIGKFADIPYETPRDLKKTLGYLAYLSEGVKSLFSKTKLKEVTYKIDGVEYHGLYSFIIVSNANRISGINDFYKDIKLDDDKFEVLLCNISKKKDIIKSLYFLTKYDISKVPGIYSYKASNMEIEFKKEPKKSWCIDGEKLEDDNTKFNIKIDKSIKMLIPSKNVKKLFINNE